MLKYFIFFFYSFSLLSEEGSFSYLEATIDSIHQAFQRQELTSEDLVHFYIERIKEHNLDLSRGAPINAFVTINPSVYEEAKRLDEHYRKTGRFIGPLHGIPLVVKDNVDSYDTPSSSGSLSLLGSQPIEDAFIVKKMREAGAIILGKTAMDEFGNGMGGKSSRSGRIGNPYNPLYSPGGSSGGSGAAINANFAVAGIGTDNSGSVRIPAAFNGLVGLRPSTGLISQTGIFPRGNLDGVVGPMARTVKDLAVLLDVIAQPDQKDPKTLEIHRPKSYLPQAKDGLKHKRIGVVQEVANNNPYAKTSPAIKAVHKGFFERLTALGAVLVDIQIPSFDLERTYNLTGEIEEINAYLSNFPSTRVNFNDICRSGRTLSFGGVKGCLAHEKETASKASGHYQGALQTFAKNRESLNQIGEKYALDAFIMPLSAFGLPSYDPYDMNTWTMPLSSNSGLPAITLIAGYFKGLPIGMELIGKMYGEKELIEMAYAYEQPRLAPKMPKPINIPLKHLSIPALNNLFTLIGFKAFQELSQKGVENVSPGNFTPLLEDLFRSPQLAP